MQVKRVVFVTSEMRKYHQFFSTIFPHFRILRGRLCRCERLFSSNFPFGASGDVYKGIPKHCQRPPALTVKPVDHFYRIQLFSFWVWVATGQCLFNDWYSRPGVLVVVCLVFTLLLEASRNGRPVHSNRVAIECLWNLTQKPQLVLVSFKVNKARVSTFIPARDPIKSVRAVGLGTSWQTVSVMWYKQHWWH